MERRGEAPTVSLEGADIIAIPITLRCNSDSGERRVDRAGEAAGVYLR
jgi:hypothetical protein